MGYSTKFDGILKFNQELTGSQLAILNEILGQDIRELSEEVRNAIIVGKDPSFYHINLELTKDFSGVKWNEMEKTSGMVDIVNSVIQWMRLQTKGCENFSFTGSLHAQGDDAEDRWDLAMVDGVAKRLETPPPGEKIECPCCGESFYYKLANEDALTFCITGTLSVGRVEIRHKIEEAGHKFTNNLSSKVDYLVCGENPGSKKSKAESIGVKIIDEVDLEGVMS